MPKKFLIYLTAFFVLFALLTGYCVEENIWQGFFHPKGAITNLFFYLITVIIHFVGVYVNEKFKPSFTQVYLLIIGFRLFGSLSYFLIMWSYHYEGMMSFTLNFLFLYFFYTVFEISSLITNLRPHLKS